MNPQDIAKLPDFMVTIVPDGGRSPICTSFGVWCEEPVTVTESKFAPSMMAIRDIMLLSASGIRVLENEGDEHGDLKAYIILNPSADVDKVTAVWDRLASDLNALLSTLDMTGNETKN